MIFPKRNEPDLDDLPAELRNEMTFYAVDDARDALTIAIEGGHIFRAQIRGIASNADGVVARPFVTHD